MRELTMEEIEVVCGGWLYPPPSPELGNPGNYKPVGRAGEIPSGNLNFIFGGSYIGLNGRAGNSGQ